MFRCSLAMDSAVAGERTPERPEDLRFVRETFFGDEAAPERADGTGFFPKLSSICPERLFFFFALVFFRFAILVHVTRILCKPSRSARAW